MRSQLAEQTLSTVFSEKKVFELDLTIWQGGKGKKIWGQVQVRLIGGSFRFEMD